MSNYQVSPQFLAALDAHRQRIRQQFPLIPGKGGSRQAGQQQVPAQGGLGQTFGNVGGNIAGKWAAKKALGAVGFGATGSAAVTTQGAAGYPATASALPELFGGGSTSTAANMSMLPEGGALSALAPAGSSYASMGTLGQVALPVAGVLGAKQVVDTFGQGKPGRGLAGGAAAGAAIGSIVPGIGTAIGAVIGGVAGGLSGLFHSGKHKDAVTRDHMRDEFRATGLTDKNDMVQVAPGKFVSLGKDTSSYTKYKDTRDYDLFNKDGTPIDPIIPGLIPKLDPYIKATVGDDQKRRSDATGLILKAVLATNPKNEAEAVTTLNSMFKNTGQKFR